MAVTNKAEDLVYLIDRKNRTVTSTLNARRQPDIVVFSADSKEAYVTTRVGGVIDVIDITAKRVVFHIPVGTDPHAIALGP